MSPPALATVECVPHCGYPQQSRRNSPTSATSKNVQAVDLAGHASSWPGRSTFLLISVPRGRVTQLWSCVNVRICTRPLDVRGECRGLVETPAGVESVPVPNEVIMVRILLVLSGSDHWTLNDGTTIQPITGLRSSWCRTAPSAGRVSKYTSPRRAGCDPPWIRWV
jgi:hypothetical protein